MAAIVLTWNPAEWDRWKPSYDWAVDRVERMGRLVDRWSVAHRVNIDPGAEAYLLRQGTDHGVVGHGLVTSSPSPDEHFNDPSRTINYVDLEWDRLLPLSEIIPREALEAEVPGFNWRQGARSSGNSLSEAAQDQLAQLWEREVGARAFPGPDDVPPAFPEGAMMRVTVNRYERDPRARQEAIALHGSRCRACGLDMGEVYGDLGQGYVNIHHLVPVSEMGADYRVDPQTDLVPLCPNCHAMVHREQPPLAPDELADRIRR